MLLCHNKKLMFLTSVFTTLSYVAQAQNLTAKEIYSYAQNHNYLALENLGDEINIKDENGNTALCLALINDDSQSYQTLHKYGADITVKCNLTFGMSSGDSPYGYYPQGRSYPNGGYRQPSRSSGTFLGMGPVGWTVVGALAVGGGIAAVAAGGGGGGGSSSKKHSKNDDKVPVIGPTDAEITDEDIGSAIIKKEISENGGANNGNVKVVVNSTSPVLGVSSSQPKAANALSDDKAASAKIDIEQRGTGSVYGFAVNAENSGATTSSYDSDDDASEAWNAYAQNGGNAKGQILILATNKADIYGLYGVGTLLNADAEGNKSTANGIIKISNSGSGNIYGIKNTLEDSYEYIANASSWDGTADGLINIINTGNGNVYGINSANFAYNTEIFAEEKKTSGKGVISIDNYGSGNVYGIKALKGIENVMIDSYADSDGAIGNGTASARIRLYNAGNGNSYGIFSPTIISNATATITSDERTGKEVADATGIVSLINKAKGNAYGLYSAGGTGEHKIYNTNSNYGNARTYDDYGYVGKALSTVEIANVGDGLAVGIYAKDGQIENSGDIKIHNLADGTAVGIYADGTTTVTNSGKITIDRASYKDDKATETTSDDRTYVAESTKGGKAVGIYGAKGSTIKNSGTIKIDGAKKVYGIYTEGASVINTGTIVIDGNSNHANAIKLNGGQLFQNGKVIAGADWGDGGHSDPDDGTATKYLDDEPITDKDNGHEIIGKTITENNPKSEADYLRNANNGTIKKIVQSQSTVSGIVSESVSTFNALSFGGNKTADIIIAQRGSGDVYGIKGPQVYDPSGSTDDDDEDGINVHNAVFADFDDKVATGNVTGNITIRNTGAGTGNIYGIQVKAIDPIDGSHAVNALVESESSSASATGNILIENINSDKNVYAIYSSEEATNAESDDNAKAFGYITINNIGNGNVFGIQISKNDNENANADATENGESTARIDIKNKGNGNVYGMNANGTGQGMVLYNAYADHERIEEPGSSAKAIATINIENTGKGNVYGLKSLSDIYNAFSYYNGTATGKIRISNNGKGNVYGIYGSSVIKNASAHSYNSDYYATAKGYVILLNKSSGNAYGLYSNTSGNHVMNNSESDGETQISVIELANIGSGLVVGMYSKNGQIENSGDIKIHNLADGTAVGIYADGTTNASNSGTIIIDRESYKDDRATDKTSDDVTYKAKSTKGGRAVGIYGAAGSNITNKGTIKINNAKTAYGIYTEGGSGSVTNNGTILIDGQYTENAIKLNGGQLFQNGKVIAGADWGDGDPCYGVTCGANATCSVVNNLGVCQCNAGYEGNANTGCTRVDEETSSDIGKTLTGSFVSGSSYDDGEGEDYYEAFNNDNVTVNRSSDNKVIGIRFYSEKSYNAETLLESLTSSASVNVTQRGKGGVYGLLATKHQKQTNDMIEVRNASADGAGNATASIIVTNTGNGDAYGIYADYTDNSIKDSEVFNAFTEASTDTEHFQNIKSVSKGEINISNTKNGKVYGIQATYSINANAETEIGENQTAEAIADGLINISNTGNGDVYGMKATKYAVNAIADTYVEFSSYHKTASTKATGRIRIDNSGSGSMYGLYGNDSAENTITSLGSESASGTTTAKATGIINLINKGNGCAYGIYAPKVSNNSDTNTTSTIEIANVGNGTAVGIYAKNGRIENSGTIKIHNLADGTAVGIYADGTTTVTNSGKITIDRASYKDDRATTDTSDDKTYTADTSKIGRAYGIYGSANSNITNTADGVIEINGADGDSYGIYVENGGVVNNNGTIKINGNSSHANRINLNGSALFQNGTLNFSSIDTSAPTHQPASLNLNDFGGTVVASDTSQFIVEGAISGDLAMNNSVVENGFETTYSVKDMVLAGDAGGLNLISQSALFDAKLENNTDAVMTMKAFNDVVENSSVADFLQNNYAENNNEDLFKALKSAETVAQLNSNIDDLFGKDMLSHMAFEDLSMAREINFDMNNRLFEKEGTFAIGENISPSGSDNHIGSIGRYSLNGFNNGKLSFGVGVSIADVRTGTGYNDNRRFDRNFMMSAPVGYKTHGFELITAPKMGYAYGTYDRKGFEGKTFDGKVQKRMFALMNEARYPVEFASVKLIPSAEFNMIGYNIKGHENEQQYALRIKSQNHYSAEAGLGLMAQKEFKPYKDHKFNISGGVAIYHEFADPYELDVAMSGMSGTYRLHDEKRSDNRAVARFGFGYKLKDNLDISASLLENIDREYRSDAKIDLNYHF